MTAQEPTFHVPSCRVRNAPRCNLLTRSRKSINACASSPRKLLMTLMLDLRLRSDRTFARHSSEVISIEYTLAQSCVSNDPMSPLSTHRERRRGSVLKGSVSQGMFATRCAIVSEGWWAGAPQAAAVYMSTNTHDAVRTAAAQRYPDRSDSQLRLPWR